MILKIILFILLLLVISLLIFFLSCILVPAIIENASGVESLVFSKIEHKFKKLDNQQEEVEEIKTSEKRAFVLCSCNKNFAKKTDIKSLKSHSCSIIYSQYETLNDCRFSCIGLGDCAKVCPQNAIIIKNNTALITDLCIGCGRCAEVCPKKIIKLVDSSVKKVDSCSNTTQELTSCSDFNNSMLVERPEKKYFKIWKSCYKIISRK